MLEIYGALVAHQHITMQKHPLLGPMEEAAQLFGLQILIYFAVVNYCKERK